MKKDYTDLLRYVGSRFQTFREKTGLSREEAAKEIGISSRTLAAYERGEREINMDTAQKMAVVYKTTLTNLTDYKNLLT